MIGGREVRKFARHGGSLWVSVPRDMAIRMGVKNGSPAYVCQPYTDVLLILRGDAPFQEADGPETRGILTAVLDGSRESLRSSLGGFEPPEAVPCGVCKGGGAVFTFSSVSVCPPCERELAAWWLHRLSPCPSELSV